ncbi:MucBP domain-containing protein [Lactococcus lactis]
MTNLSIGGTSVDNSVLAKIVNLKALVRLYMDSNMNITNIEPLKVFNLKSLSVQFCGITDFTVIKDFPIMSDLAAFGQNTGRNDPPTTVTRSSLKYNEDEQSVYIPFSMMPNRMMNFDGYIPPFSTSNSASNTYFDFNGTQLPASRLQIDDNGITINSVSPEEYQGIKSFEYNARLNNPAGTYAVPDGYTFYAISSGTYLHQFDVVDDGAPVTVKYQDENGQELAPSELLNGYVGATYNSKELSFQGYSLIKVDGDATGKFTDSPQTVTYIYQKNAKLLGQVTVKYIDTDGKALFGDVIQTGNIGETYHTEKKELTGYTFKNIIGNASGQYTNSPQTVTYVYEKNAKILGQVTVKYIDTEGKSLFGDVIQTGNIGETYHTEKKELTGYSFKNIIGNTTGQYTNIPQTVTYVYKKNTNPNKPEEVIPDSSDKNNVNPDSRENETTKGSKTVKDKESVVTSKEKNLPETGDKEQGMKKITLFGSFLLILGSLVLFIRFRKVDKL